jgi:hypothetical protein
VLHFMAMGKRESAMCSQTLQSNTLTLTSSTLTTLYGAPRVAGHSPTLAEPARACLLDIPRPGVPGSVSVHQVTPPSRRSIPALRRSVRAHANPVRRDAEQTGGAPARVPRVPARRQWLCAFSVSPPIFRDRERRPWTIKGGMLGPAPPEWADTVLRYGCVLTVAVCHSRCLKGFFDRAFPDPTTDLGVGFACGTDGLQAHDSGLGLVVDRDTKSVR